MLSVLKYLTVSFYLYYLMLFFGVFYKKEILMRVGLSVSYIRYNVIVESKGILQSCPKSPNLYFNHASILFFILLWWRYKSKFGSEINFCNILCAAAVGIFLNVKSDYLNFLLIANFVTIKKHLFFPFNLMFYSLPGPILP